MAGKRDEDGFHQNYQNHKKLESDWIFQEPKSEPSSLAPEEDRKEKRPKEESGTNRLNSEQRKTEETPDKTLPSTIGQVEPKTPITPRNSYMELEKLGQFNLKVPPRYFNPRKPKTPNEEEVVDAISKWRLTDAISPDDQTANHLEKGKEKQKEPLKKDNVAPEEVVEIIKEYRSDKIAYTRLSDSPTDNELRKKVGEIEEIFDVNYHLMEWKAIQGEIIDEIKEEKKMSGMNDFRKWMNEEKNYLILAKKVIIRAENHGLFQVFTEMNEDFSRRLEDENRYQDNKEIGDKRPILESPEVPEREPWLVTAEGSEEEEDEEEEKIKNREKKGDFITNSYILFVTSEFGSSFFIPSVKDNQKNFYFVIQKNITPVMFDFRINIFDY
ncbi:hypothetical protein RhiirA4_504256 [Rhizophagus irregularis]|uniref:Uncharacterized protein n=1 Tax=Rhizophagus irregularis TaxID=588596 RepID=A0A2I1H999_9GLOM|nr:hypothetical protein RhiirA4_504256 [Rhizophagus irregularis]